MARGRGCTRLPFACASFEPAAAIVNVATTLTSASGRQREIRAPILPPPDPPIDRESCRRSKPQIRRPGCNRNATVAGKVATIGRCLGVTSAAPRTRSAPPPLAEEGWGGGEHKRSILLGAPSLSLLR